MPVLSRTVLSVSSAPQVAFGLIDRKEKPLKAWRRIDRPSSAEPLAKQLQLVLREQADRNDLPFEHLLPQRAKPQCRAFRYGTNFRHAAGYWLLGQWPCKWWIRRIAKALPGFQIAEPFFDLTDLRRRKSLNYAVEEGSRSTNVGVVRSRAVMSHMSAGSVGFPTRL